MASVSSVFLSFLECKLGKRDELHLNKTVLGKGGEKSDEVASFRSEHDFEEY